MKKIIFVYFILLLSITGCGYNKMKNMTIQTSVSNNQTKTTISQPTQKAKKTIPNLTKKVVLKMVSEASLKYHIISMGGWGIPNCVFENKQPVTIKGLEYVFLCNKVDTMDKMKQYLGDVLTEKSINTALDSQGITQYKGNLIRPNADAGDGLDWKHAQVISLEQTEDHAMVNFKIPLMVEDSMHNQKQIPFQYVEGKGWLIDTEKPNDLY